MKIGGKKEVSADTCIKKANQNEQLKKPGTGAAPGARTGGDCVALSPRAMELNKAKSLLDNVPEVRGEMVVRLKADIDSGDYSVNAGKVAEKMIERALIDSLHAKKH